MSFHDMNQNQVPILLHALPGPETALYCWDAEGAVRLRRDHRLLGALVGGVAQFKNQNAVNGLPMLLGQDEATIALQQGWAKVCPPALEVAVDEPEDQPKPSTDAGWGAASRKRHRAGGRQGGRDWLQDGTEEYFAYYERLGACGRSAQLQRLEQEQQLGQGQQQQHTLADTTGEIAEEHHQLQPFGQPVQHDSLGRTRLLAFSRASQPGCTFKLPPLLDTTPPLVWKQALSDGSNFLLPLHPSAPGQLLKSPQRELEQQQQKLQGQGQGKKKQKVQKHGEQQEQQQQQQQREQQKQQQEAEQQKKQYELEQREQQMRVHVASQPSVPLAYPSNPSQDLRLSLFKDLHAQGYAMSAGPKFGADLLAYPGDPGLFHAQFTVRIVEPGAALCPTALKAAVRGSHAARKHLLLASMLPAGMPDVEDREAGKQQQQPFYISIGPETGFGSAK